MAKAAIRFVTGKLASELQSINQQDISQKNKIKAFVTTYFTFIEKTPEMIEYFFRVYLSNRELFCDDDACGFSWAKEFIDKVENLIIEGVDNSEFRPMDFHISFSLITGMLGSMTFLSGEKVLKKDLHIYTDDVTPAIYTALSC